MGNHLYAACRAGRAGGVRVGNHLYAACRAGREGGVMAGNHARMGFDTITLNRRAGRAGGVSRRTARF